MKREVYTPEVEGLRALVNKLHHEIRTAEHPELDSFLYPPSEVQKAREHYRALAKLVYDTLYPDWTDEQKYQQSVNDEEND